MELRVIPLLKSDLLPALLCLAAACSTPVDSSSGSIERSRAAIQQETGIRFYHGPVVLFINPDDRKLEQLRREYGEDFYTVADDAMWYRSQAYELLDEAGIPYAHPEGAAAWFEVGGELRHFSWSDEDAGWFLVFYDGSGEPRVLHDLELPSVIEEMYPNLSP